MKRQSTALPTRTRDVAQPSPAALAIRKARKRPDLPTPIEEPIPTSTSPLDEFIIPDEDPEQAILNLKKTSLTVVKDLLPHLHEKARNASASDALEIFTALADRSGFAPPTKTEAAPVQILNITTPELGTMLSGLKQITDN